MPKYELTLTSNIQGNPTPDMFDRIIADDLVSLLAQFIIMIGTLHRLEMEHFNRPPDDDVPF